VSVLRIVEDRFASVDASWGRCFRRSLYIPAVAQQQLAGLKNAPAVDVQRELDRLAALGSPWASAVLGYQALLRRPDGSREVDKAIALCSEPAARGDAYSQYLMYWASHLKGNQREAIGYLKASVGQCFPPAVLDSVAFFWTTRRETNPLGVLKPLSQAETVGHYGAFLWRCKLYMTGRLGRWRSFVGYICFPIAALLLIYHSLRHPFSARTFIFDLRSPAVSIFSHR
jgi:hypothetical protein